MAEVNEGATSQSPQVQEGHRVAGAQHEQRGQWVGKGQFSSMSEPPPSVPDLLAPPVAPPPAEAPVQPQKPPQQAPRSRRTG